MVWKGAGGPASLTPAGVRAFGPARKVFLSCRTPTWVGVDFVVETGIPLPSCGTRRRGNRSEPVKWNRAVGDSWNMDPDDFGEVLTAAQSGTPWACTELWVRYAPRVTAFLRARGSHEPEDLTSDVFLTVFKNLHAFCGDESGFRAYLFTIARRRLIDELRRRSRRPTQDEWSEAADTRRTSSAEDHALDQAGTAWARDMIDSLSPDQRDVLLLRIFGDFTVEQVAEVLGKPEGAVKALQRRGLAALRRKGAHNPYPSGPAERWQGVR